MPSPASPKESWYLFTTTPPPAPPRPKFSRFRCGTSFSVSHSWAAEIPPSLFRSCSLPPSLPKNSWQVKPRKTGQVSKDKEL